MARKFEPCQLFGLIADVEAGWIAKQGKAVLGSI
jgi:hypothetical protein